MANPQPDKFTKLSNELYEAIMTADFSKRQRKVLDLIIRMSYGCQKKYALIRPIDFELVGVWKVDIQKELKHLEKSKVIFRDGDRIELNKNYDQWRIGIVKSFDEDKMKALIKRNLEQKEVSETLTEHTDGLVKHLPTGKQNTNYEVSKILTDTAPNPSNDNGFEPRKEIVNKSTTTIITNDDLTEQEKAARQVAEYWRDKQNVVYVSNADLNIINDLVVEKHISANTIIEVIEDLYSRFEEQNKDKPWKKIKSIKYFVDRILEVHHEKTNPKPVNNVTPFRKQRHRPGKPNDLPMVMRPEYQQQQEEISPEELEKQKRLVLEKLKRLKAGNEQ